MYFIYLKYELLWFSRVTIQLPTGSYISGSLLLLVTRTACKWLPIIDLCSYHICVLPGVHTILQHTCTSISGKSNRHPTTPLLFSHLVCFLIYEKCGYDIYSVDWWYLYRYVGQLRFKVASNRCPFKLLKVLHVQMV